MTFTLPAGLLGRFAVVKPFSCSMTAKDECIARLKLAAKRMGLTCIEIHTDGRFVSDPTREVSNDSFDFVIHLHFETPKLYDVFSFVVLWNPVQFYYENDYQRALHNLMSHDDFLSCLSIVADDHAARLVRHQYRHLPPELRLYQSLPSDALSD